MPVNAEAHTVRGGAGDCDSDAGDRRANVMEWRPAWSEQVKERRAQMRMRSLFGGRRWRR